MRLNYYLREFIRNVPDFPKPGILFRDITPLLQNPFAFKLTIELLRKENQGKNIDKVVAIESRGFILGGALALELNCGLVLVRKPGKLPSTTINTHYDLEYGSNTLEIHQDSIIDGDKCLIVDDLLATGGTARAAIELVENLKGTIVGCSFLVALTDLKGISLANEYPCHWLIEFGEI